MAFLENQNFNGLCISVWAFCVLCPTLWNFELLSWFLTLWIWYCGRLYSGAWFLLKLCTLFYGYQLFFVEFLITYWLISIKSKQFYILKKLSWTIAFENRFWLLGLTISGTNIQISVLSADRSFVTSWGSFGLVREVNFCWVRRLAFQN